MSEEEIKMDKKELLEELLENINIEISGAEDRIAVIRELGERKFIFERSKDFYEGLRKGLIWQTEALDRLRDLIKNIKGKGTEDSKNSTK